MSKRLKQDKSIGPKGEIVTVNWMPGNRVRIDFKKCGSVVVTKVYPKQKITNIEVNFSA